jgi:multiple sugar transport system permease protein
MNTMDYLTPEEAIKYRRIAIAKKVGLYTFLTIFGLFILVPFYWMIATSFKSSNEIISSIQATFFPLEPSLEGYRYVLGEGADLLRYMGNTVVVAIISTALTLVTTILSAFAFARLEFKGKNLLFSILLSTMMIPGEMLVITNFLTVSKLGWLDTWQVLIIPHCVSIFYIYFLRQTFMGIPNELYYAAKIDGKSDFEYLWRIMIPIAKPTLFTITILSLIGSWNAYIWPRTVIVASDGPQMITPGLMKLLSGEYIYDNMRMAGAVITSLPLLILFICFKKYIMRGVSRSGIKG